MSRKKAMKTKELVSSSATNLDENSHLLAIFPTEVWTSILKNVKEFQDYLRICDSSQVFHSLFSSQRARILFPSVFHVLMEHKSFTNNCDELKKLRWAYCLGLKHRLYISAEIRSRTKNVMLRNLDELRVFHEQTENSALPFADYPYVYGSITINFAQHQQDLMAYISVLLRSLMKIGRWVCNCVIKMEELRDHQLDKIEWLHFFRCVLERLPSLQSMDLQFPSRWISSKDDLDKIQRYLRHSPLPAFRNLTSVKHRRAPDVLIDNIVEKNPNVFCWSQFTETIGPGSYYKKEYL